MLELEHRGQLCRACYEDIDSLGNASSIDKHIKRAVMVVNILNGLTNAFAITHIDTVKANIDASLLTKLACGLVAKLLLNVKNGNAAYANFGKCLSHVESEPTAATTRKVSRMFIMLS